MIVRGTVACLAAGLLSLCAGSCGGGDAAAAPDGGVQGTAVAPEPVQIGDPTSTELIVVEGGVYLPLFPGKDAPKQVPVAPFRLDRHAVSNAQFLAFVGQRPQWRRSRVKRVFADTNYLSHWLGDLDVGEGMAQCPVVNVSWFAARAYAAWAGKRLPTTAEWELVGAILPESGGDNARAILDWYARPTDVRLTEVTQGIPNTAGFLGMHGVVWEWVDDFQAAMVTGDGRGDSDLERNLFCGAGSVGAARPEDYASFMRLALRSSLGAQYCVRNLGFRCAADALSK